MTTVILSNHAVISALVGAFLPTLIGLFTGLVGSLKLGRENIKRIKFIISALICLLFSFCVSFYYGEDVLKVFAFILSSSEITYRLGWSNLNKKK